ncbi:tail fiber domain-containing protein [Salmonella enterica subsp. enterica]|nr:tail fiber domain-containing protein [Salmonella enterica subsp. enterica]EDT7115468.1 tail fiber domain-containing protein [Salmonella enterica subsp. enterica]EDW2006422.1 tail fiber domain-containing protein [Salmonella enterica subsp. enterica]EEC0393379.1 tail fiber domain-containing protein [Salmonella enterica subsp. enterica]EED4536206.1 tail fiber domain-containing protein [Salmonella enterica subsp. enterica]
MKSIQFKRTGVAGKIPTPESLQVGEIALNLTDHVIFTKDKEHKVVQISVSPETHTALESKVDANKKELDQTIALNDQTINAKVDEIKTATDATISANDQAINTKVDNIKRETDATILANKNTAASELATVQEDLTKVINANKDAAAVATEELDTRINAKVDGIKERTDATILANDTAIHEKVDLIKATTDRTIADNAQHAQNQLEATYNHLTGVIEANKQEAAEAVTALSGTVEAKDTAIHKKVDGNKAHTDSEITRLESRIDNIDGSSDGKFIKKDTDTTTEGYLLSRTANYLENPALQSSEYLNYFGPYRVNGLDNWGDYTGLILNVPHSAGKAHGRGFSFQYGSAGSQVRTYGFDANGEKAFSHRMYHEGDKPTPAELNVYSKEEVNSLFQKSLWLGHAGGAGWFKIASVALPQIGSQAFIRLIGGNGFNAGTIAQTNVYELVMRSSNANPHGLTFTVYQHLQGMDNQFCAVHTGADNFDIYALYYEFSAHVMAEYGVAGGNITVYDNPEKFGEKPEGTVTDALRVNMFNSVNNKGTLNFNANQQQEYDIDHLNSVAADGKNYLRRFRSSSAAAIWHETVHQGAYRLATGSSDASQEFLIEAGHNGRSSRVTAGMFTADGGNDGFKIRYVPETESAMFQIWDRNTGNLNAYVGYGSSNQPTYSVYNRLGDIQLSAAGNINVESVLNVQRKMNIYSSDPTVEPSTHVFNIRNWGNSHVNGNRSAVLEFSDGQSYHFYSHRLTNGHIEAGFAGTLTAGTMWAHGDMNVAGNAYIRGGHGLEIVSDTNRHIWFRNNAGTEMGVLYAENDGGVKLRTSNQQFSTHFHNGMIHITGLPTTGSDKGLIRGHVGGGAWVDWRERPAGILVDCQDSRNQAYNIWKATHWGDQHIAAMGVHAGGGHSTVVLHVGGSDYSFAFNGDFTAGAAVYCNDVYIRSDRRLKINVEDYTQNAVEKVNKLKVKTYDKVKSLSDREVIGREIGIIAQDLQEILPEAVSTSNVGSPDNPEEILTISNSSVNALLIKAVQEMSKRIEYLESLVK